MADPVRQTRTSPLLLLLVGVALVLAGLGMLAPVVFAVYAGTPQASDLAFRLGIGGTSLLSALSQIALLVGLWMIWRAFRRRP